MPVIKVHPDAFCGDIIESPYIPYDGQTLKEWLTANVPSYDPNIEPPFIAKLNGVEMTREQIETYNINIDDTIDINVVPGDPGTLATLYQIYQVLQVIAIAYSIYSYYKLSQQKKPGSPSTPNSIYDANIQANQPRLLGIIPEVFGRMKMFPDIISAPWREYVDDDQWINLMLCVGVGRFEINPSEIFIGLTPIDRYAGDVDYQIFEPGEDVTGHTAHQNMYTSAEVGVNGSANGLELKGVSMIIGSPSSNVVRASFSGIHMHLSVDAGGGIGGAVGTAEILDRLDDIPVGEILEIITSTGTNDGFYKVLTITDNGRDYDLIKMLEDLSDEDPDWADSPFDQFITESGVNIQIRRMSLDGELGEWLGPFLACPATEQVEEFIVDLTFPGGLVEIDENGDKNSRDVDVDIAWREVGTIPWSTESVHFHDHTVDQLGFSIPINGLGGITPEVRMRRTSRDSTKVNVQDTVMWVALRSKLVPATSYPGLTTIALRVKGTNAISSQSENRFNIIATRKLSEIADDSNGFTDETPTRKISAAFAYINSSIGNEDSRLDLDELTRLDTIWNAREDYFDGMFNEDNTFFDSLKSLVAVGYAVPILEFDRISLSRDEPRTVYQQMYQPGNVVGGIQRDIKLVDEDEPDGILVTYLSAVTWRPETVLCVLPGDVGANPEQVNAFGITDRTKAWRFGMRKRREKQYRRIKYTFQTEMDAFNSSFGSYVAIGDDLPDYSQTGHVDAVDGRILTLSEMPNFEDSGDTYYIALRNPQGSLSGPYAAVPVPGELFQVEIDDDLDFEPILDGTGEPPHYQFGISERMTEPALVVNIQPQGMERVDVEALNYDARVYADDDNEAPE